MIRINLVEPSYLTDNDLIAEYCELPKIFEMVEKLQEEGKTPSDVKIPDNYILGKTHANFFYNKIGWLRFRFERIYKELVMSRNYNLDDSLWRSTTQKSYNINSDWNTEYTPTPEEIYLNMATLCVCSNLTEVLMEITDR